MLSKRRCQKREGREAIDRSSRLGVFSFLTPLFGIVFGAWLLNEPIELSFLLGAVPVLIGIVLVSGAGWVALMWDRSVRAT